MKMIGGLIAIFIAITMVAGVLVPVVSDGLTVVGDPITLQTGGSQANVRLGEVGEGDIITLVVGDGSVTINGEVLTLDSPSTWTPVIYMDTGLVELRASTYAVNLKMYGEHTAPTTVSCPAGTTITVSDGVLTADLETPVSIEYGVCYSVGSDNNLAMLVDMGTRNDGASLISSVNDIIIYGYYETGENDTNYSYVDGKLTVEEDFTSSISYDLTLKEGTTDIYELNEFSINVGGESFTPYHALVPFYVDGHADSGSAYDMLKIIIPLMIIAIIAASIALIVTRRY